MPSKRLETKVFLTAEERTRLDAVSYENRAGKYQNQPESVTLARV